jgi:hypothetical protein
MSDAPVLGSPVAITTLEDGRFSVEFGWKRSPDAIWLKTLADLMRRSGQTSIVAASDGLTVTFTPQDADGALDGLTDLLTEADRQYQTDVEHREAAIQHVRDALTNRFGPGHDLPVRES